MPSTKNADTEIDPQPSVWCCGKVPKRERIKKTTTKILSTPYSRVPFSGDVPKGSLVEGKLIVVKGTILPDCSRFAIDLGCGRGASSDIAFHLNPRLLQRYIVRNSKLNGQWGEEEHTNAGKFTLARGQKFNITIFVAKDCFLISVNGIHICSYNFRTPLSRIKVLQISGSVEVQSVDYSSMAVLPGNRAIIVDRRKKDQEDSDADVMFQDVPLTVLLPQGFHQGWQLEIYGRVKILPHSFYVNLQEGVQQWPHPIVALHLNPRFGQGNEESVFVRNAWTGAWGSEERTPGFQFAPGSAFRMAIRRANDHFSVWIDGKLVGEFKFRSNPDKVNAVHIHGDLRVATVTLDEEPSKLLFTANAMSRE